MPGFYFSIFDIDGMAPGSNEKVIVEDYTEYVDQLVATGLFGSAGQSLTSGPGLLGPALHNKPRGIESVCSISQIVVLSPHR